MNKKSKMKIAPFTLSFVGNTVNTVSPITFKKASRINKKTLGDQDAHSKVVDVFGVENDAGDRIGDSFVIDDSLATA